MLIVGNIHSYLLFHSQCFFIVSENLEFGISFSYTNLYFNTTSARFSHITSSKTRCIGVKNVDNKDFILQ